MKNAKKYFLNNDSEHCYTLDVIKDMMRANEEIERMVFPAEIVYGSEFFWCDEFMEVGETGESCGKECKKYSPRNGKNGGCRHHKNCYTHADKPITIKINQ